jgi:predicted transcriptional regulator
MSSENGTNNMGRYLILRLINQIPGIRYNDIARITNLNNGVISYSLCVLKKNYFIKVVRYSNGKVARYFASSISNEDCLIIGYLKNGTTNKIILFLYFNGESNFKKIRSHINKAPSTTSWNLKRLIDDDIIIKSRTQSHQYYIIKNPLIVTKVLQNFAQLFLDRDTIAMKLSIAV